MRKLIVDWRYHPEKDEAWYRNEVLNSTKDEVAREIDRSYDLSVAAAVFYNEFKPQHVVQEYHWNPDWNVAVGFDFGRTNCSVICQLDNYQRIRAVKEFLLTASNTEELASLTWEWLGQQDIRGIIEAFPDPAGSTRGHQKKVQSTDIETLRDIGFVNVHYERAQRLTDRLKQGVSVIKKLLSRRLAGEERIVIYQPGCPTLVQAMQSGYVYRTDANGEILDTVDEPNHPYEDPVDCLRYICIDKFHHDIQARKENARSRDDAGVVGGRDDFGI